MGDSGDFVFFTIGAGESILLYIRDSTTDIPASGNKEVGGVAE